MRKLSLKRIISCLIGLIGILGFIFVTFALLFYGQRPPIEQTIGFIIWVAIPVVLLSTICLSIMFKLLNKSLSVPIAVGIIFTVTLASFAFWQYQKILKVEIELLESEFLQKEGKEDKKTFLVEVFEEDKEKTINWNIYRNEEYGFQMMYPENVLIEELQEGINFSVTDRECKIIPSHHCPVFMWITKFGETFLDRAFGLDEFKEFKITPEESGWWVDCVQKAAIEDNISGYKVHRWIQSTGECYYIFQKGNFMIGISRSEGGLECDSCNNDQLFNQILSTFRFLD